MNKYSSLKVGVLALQGDYARHCYQLELLGVTPVEVRTAEALVKVAALIIPGGESTTINTLIDRFDLRRPLVEFGQAKGVWGTCAGMIMMAKNVEENRAGLTPLGLIDIDVVRNGYGRQVFSFEESLTADLGNGPAGLTATFIRAPRVTRLGAKVQALAAYRNSPVLLRQGHLVASSFHSELDDDTTLLRYFLQKVVGGA
ncbi:MAG TPA: pyridoxal 5'-phosphate synthase glutaminase subunit PdxT [Candidatus Deferrimicrobium sp.]|nr:pyridoxal 5'-phosphate synthase glutaminase subunit PdxT [Candidatus Deferrimicrobium sp.]